MADLIYNNFKTKLLNGANIDLDDDTLKVALVTSSYTPDQDAHEFFDDVTNEISGTGYTAGGEALTSTTVTQDDANDRVDMDAANVEWTTATFTAAAAVLYKDTGTASTSPLILYWDFGGDQTVTAQTFRLVFNASGILRLT